MKNLFDSIIFDLDGTLWDASDSCTKAWNEALASNQVSQVSFDQATIRSFSGMKIESILTRYLSAVPKHQHQDILSAYHENERRLMHTLGGELFPGVKPVLTSLKDRYKLFIVSNCASGYIENFLLFHDLGGLFTDFESSGRTGLSKSENIRSIVNRNHLEKPVYIGDTVWDLEAAQTANVPFIYAAYGFGQVQDPKNEISSFKELEDILLNSY